MPFGNGDNDFEKGNTIHFEVTFEDSDGNVKQPDFNNNSEPKVFVEAYNASTDNTVLSSTRMNKISNTQFEYDWQTTEGYTEGQYVVEASASVSNNTVLNREYIEIRDIVQ